MIGKRISFSAGYFTLTGTVVADGGEMLQVQIDNGSVQPVSASKVTLI